MARKPNILFLMADQLAAPVLPAYGHNVVQSPHIDALAARGVVFDSAYCNFPLCAPSRFSLLSGRLPSRIGAYDNGAEFPASAPTFLHYLRRSGYRTCLSGKMHFVGPDQLHGFEERLTTDVYPADFLWSADWSQAEDHWEPWYHSMRAILDAGPWRRSINIRYDDEVTQEAVRWLHDRADSQDPRPFCLAVSFISPHDPYLAPPAYWQRYSDEDIDSPRVADIPLNERDLHSWRHYYLTGRHKEPITEAQVRQARRAYYGVTSYVDHQIGAVLEAVAATGESDHTIVVLTSDHGDMLGERGLFFKMSFYEWASRVPLILSGPDIGAGQRVAQNVSLLDLFPTFLELAEAGEPGQLAAPVDGHSLVPLLGGDPVGWPDTVFAEYTAEGCKDPQFMVRQGPWKLMFSERDGALLYDLEQDPDERHNRANDPEFAPQRQAITELVYQTWDPAQVSTQVKAHQRVRCLLHEALGAGKRTPWGYQPRRDVSKEYFRALMDVQDSYRTT